METPQYVNNYTNIQYTNNCYSRQSIGSTEEMHIDIPQCELVIDTSSVSGYLGSRETSFRSEIPDYMYLTPEEFEDASGSILNFGACVNDSGLPAKAADDKGTHPEIQEEVNYEMYVYI